MTRLFRGLLTAAALAVAWSGTSAFSPPAKAIKVALQDGGTAAWEAAAMQELKLDLHHGVKLVIRAVADSAAGQAALQADDVDIILSDIIRVSAQRDMGSDFTFVPHALAMGGLLVAPGGPVAAVADLQGKTLAVAGGPVDKSYLILQTYYTKMTGADLTADSQAEFGAPPMVNELLAGGGAGYTDADILAATEAFAVLAAVGGSDQIGDNPALAEGTFWAGYRR